MRVVSIGLVTEGPTDQVVISRLFGAHLSKVFPTFVFKFLDLHPTPDQTSSGVGGGWSNVFAWCLRNPPDLRAALFHGAGIFSDGLDGSSCDLIIVHLDADIAPLIGTKTKVLFDPTEVVDAQSFGAFIRLVILDWLWPSSSVPDGRHIPAPAVMAIEAWLIAGLDDSMDPQSIVDGKVRLKRICATIGKVSRVQGRKVKVIDMYGDLAGHCETRTGRIIDRCTHFASLANEIVDVLSV